MKEDAVQEPEAMTTKSAFMVVPSLHLTPVVRPPTFESPLASFPPMTLPPIDRTRSVILVMPCAAKAHPPSRLRNPFIPSMAPIFTSDGNADWMASRPSNFRTCAPIATSFAKDSDAYASFDPRTTTPDLHRWVASDQMLGLRLI